MSISSNKHLLSLAHSIPQHHIQEQEYVALIVWIPQTEGRKALRITSPITNILALASTFR